MSTRLRLMREERAGDCAVRLLPTGPPKGPLEPPLKLLQQLSAVAASSLTGSVSVAGSLYTASLNESGLLSLFDADKCVGETHVPAEALGRLKLSAASGGLNNGSLLWLRRTCPDFGAFLDALEATPPSGCTSWLKTCAYPAALFWLLLCVFIAFGGEGLQAEEAAEAAAASTTSQRQQLLPVGDRDYVSLARFRGSPLGRLLLAKKQQLRRSVQSLASVRGIMTSPGAAASGASTLAYM